jgi:hypothetical protein
LDSVAHNLCFGGNEGYISTTVSGGSGLYVANWNSNPIQTTPYAANLVAGIYSLVIEDTNGCTDTLTQEITQPAGSFPVISGNFDPTAMANEQYTVNTWPGASYVWTVNGGSILSGDSTETIIVIWNNINTGTVSVVQTDSTGCVLSDINVVYVNATDIVENQDSYQMYPNPANQYTSFVWGNQKLRRYEVSDAMGRRILSQSSAADFYQLDVSEWEAGLYFVRITDGETEKVEKLIVEK